MIHLKCSWPVFLLALTGCMPGPGLTYMQRQMAAGQYQKIIQEIPAETVKASGRYRDFVDYDLASVRVKGAAARPLLCEAVLAQYPDSIAVTMQACRMLVKHAQGQLIPESDFDLLSRSLYRENVKQNLFLQDQLQKLNELPGMAIPR